MRRINSRRLIRSLAVAGVAVTASLVAAPAAMAGTIDSSPHNYTADGTAADSYGSGTLTGSPSYVAVPNSYPSDQAFYFDGTTQLAAPNSTIVNYGTRNFSVSFKFATSSDTIQDLLSKRANCSGSNVPAFLDIRTGVGSDHLLAELKDSSNGASITLPFSFADGVYHTVFLTRNGTTVTFGVDGQSAQTTTAAPVNLDNTTPLTFANGGCVGVDGTQRLTGAIDAAQFNVTVPPNVALPDAPAAIALALAGLFVVGAAYLVKGSRTA